MHMVMAYVVSFVGQQRNWSDGLDTVMTSAALF